jgi:hypothetical protein
MLLGIFILVSVNFIIVSDERMAKFFREIILKKMVYTLLIDLISIFSSYLPSNHFSFPKIRSL